MPPTSNPDCLELEDRSPVDLGGITKEGTVKNIAVLKEHIRGEGATVHISIAYEDGTSSQGEEMLWKVDGKWKVSLVGLMWKDYNPSRYGL